TALLLVRMSMRHASPAISALVIFPVATFGPLMLWSVAGLESSLYLSLVAGALLSAMQERNRAPQKIPISACLMVVAILARSDAGIYFPAVLIASWNRERTWQSLRSIAVFVVGVFLVWSGHALYYHELLPNPLLSKVLGLYDRL